MKSYAQNWKMGVVPKLLLTVPGLLISSLLLLSVQDTHLVAEDAAACVVKKKKDDSKKETKKSNKKSAKPEKKTPAQLEAEKKKAAKKKAIRKKNLENLKLQILYAASRARQGAINRVPQLKEDEQAGFIKPLMDIARDELDVQVRDKAIRVLGQLRSTKALPVFQNAVNDKNSVIQAAAVYSLGKLNKPFDSKSVVILLKKLDYKKHDELLLSVIRLLGKINWKEDTAFIKKKAQDVETNDQVRQVLMLYFGKVKALEHVDFLLSVSKDQDVSVASRAMAVNSLGKLKNKKAVKPLRELMVEIRDTKDGREKVRLLALRMHIFTALIRLGDQSMQRDIIAAARSNDSRERLRAVKQLGNMRLKSVRGLLCYKWKYDESRSVRKAAEIAILKIDGDYKE